MTKDDKELDPGLDEGWKLEIARRVAEIDSGAVKPIPWAEARARLRAALRDAE
jgi:putative addiction module component (TIGR02574 family)